MERNNMKHDMHIRPGFADPSPYPEVKVSAPSKYYAKLIMDDYAGKISEFTAVAQYLHHKFSFNDKYKDLANIIQNISITEMHHMDMIADMLRQLGVDPVFKNGTGDYWDGSYVYYGFNVCDKLKGDLKSELDAIRTYELHIQLIKDPNIQAVLKRIILDEKLHARIFEEQIKKYCENK